MSCIEFVVCLPLAAPLPERPDRSAVTRPVSVPARPRRILVVDDNKSFAIAMTALLRAMGHDVRTSADGRTAIATAQAFRPHIVLLDVGLPGRSGYDVARELRRDPALASVRIVAITGYGQASDKRAAMAAGFDQHRTKPVDDEVLEALIDTAGVD
jgi:CheY-like chemotaxis protein